MEHVPGPEGAQRSRHGDAFCQGELAVVVVPGFSSTIGDHHLAPALLPCRIGGARERARPHLLQHRPRGHIEVDGVQVQVGDGVAMVETHLGPVPLRGGQALVPDLVQVEPTVPVRHDHRCRCRAGTDHPLGLAQVDDDHAGTAGHVCGPGDVADVDPFGLESGHDLLALDVVTDDTAEPDRHTLPCSRDCRSGGRTSTGAQDLPRRHPLIGTWRLVDGDDHIQVRRPDAQQLYCHLRPLSISVRVA